MKFAVVGGDGRSALLCALLYADGHKVRSYALEKAELPAEIPRCTCLQSCLYGADCVVLPLPAERGGMVHAPLAAEPLGMETLTGALWRGQVLCGGGLSERTRIDALNAGVRVEDILHRKAFTVGNAAITAEGALERMMALSPSTLWRSRVLVTGWGRIAKLLSLRLRSLGAKVTIAARRDGDRAMAQALGMEAVDYPSLPDVLGQFRFIVNTVPARVFTREMLCCIEPDALLAELASPPGGFDRSEAENLGLNAHVLPGLPGQCAPLTAAELIRDAVYDAAAEQPQV